MEFVNAKQRTARWIGTAALVVAGAIGGGVLATTVSASADSTASPAALSPAQPGGAGDRGGHVGAAPVREDEKAVSSADEAKLRAAALKAVPGGTVDRVETDAGDGAYEAHMTKADGSRVTVKFDKSFAVTTVEAGMGTGDPAPTGSR